MKKLFGFLPLLMLLMLFSCGAPQKISVSGKPGTKIYSPNMRFMGEVSSSGTAVVSMDKDNYYAYLLSKDEGSSEYVPFALNYNRDLHSGEKAAIVLGGITSFTGSFGGIICLLAGAEGAVAPFLFASAAGLGIMIFPALATELDQFEWSYSYVKKQRTNQDIAWTPITQTAEYKTIAKKGTSKSNNKQTVRPDVVESAAVVEEKVISSEVFVGSNTEQTASKPKKQKNESSIDYSSKVTGTYIGKGKLINSGEVVEKYNSVKVKITPKSENIVSVDVIMSNGLPFFRNSMTYKITKSDEKFVLKSSNVNSTITIDEYDEMIYINHNVEDRGEMCTLKINAEKE